MLLEIDTLAPLPATAPPFDVAEDPILYPKEVTLVTGSVFTANCNAFALIFTVAAL